MSSSQVSGFIATIRSTPPRRPRWLASLIRTSYQVGRPWMLDGKMLRELAGMPMRRTDLANSALALAEPDPLTLANLTTKSLTLFIECLLDRPTIIPLENTLPQRTPRLRGGRCASDPFASSAHPLRPLR